MSLAGLTRWMTGSTRPDTGDNESLESSEPAGQTFRMSVEIRPSFAGKIVGKGGSTIKSIEEKTGATVKLDNSPEHVEARYVSVQGETSQIESAVKEIRIVVASLDAEYSRNMKPNAFLVADAEKIKFLIGQNGDNIREIEAKTLTKINIEPPAPGRDRRRVTIIGDVKDIIDSLRLVEASLAKSFEERGKEMGQSTSNKAEQRNDFRPKHKHNAKEKPARVHKQNSISSTDSSTKWEDNDKKILEFLPTMRSTVRISARHETFCCLIGTDGKTIKKIIASNKSATIDVEDRPDGDEYQDVVISGTASAVVKASTAVIAALDTYKPGYGKAVVSRIEVNEFKRKTALATVDILAEMAGFVIGNKGTAIKDLKAESGVESFFVDREPDEFGIKKVNIEGEARNVITAIEKLKDWLDRLKSPSSSAKEPRMQHRPKKDAANKQHRPQKDQHRQLPPGSVPTNLRTTEHRDTDAAAAPAPAFQETRFIKQRDGAFIECVLNADGTFTPVHDLYQRQQQPPPPPVPVPSPPPNIGQETTFIRRADGALVPCIKNPDGTFSPLPINRY